MAAIEQIIQIAVNERTSGAANVLAGTANTTANTANTTANTALTNAATAQATADGAIQHSDFTIAQSAIDSGYITRTGMGNSATYAFTAPAAVNLSDVRSYTNATARNAIDNVEWHVGDIAILSESSTGTRTESVDSPYVVTGFVSSSIRIFNAWDVDNDRLRDNLGFADGDTIRFRNTSGDIVGTTSPGNNGNFVVSNIRRLTGTAHVLFDITPTLAAFNPALDVGSAIVVSQTVTFNNVSGTYLYTGAVNNDNHTGATVDGDWTLLTVPAGTASNSDLATFSLNGGASALLGAVEYNSTTDTLTINSQQIELATTTPTITRNHYQYTGADLVITGIASGTQNQVFTIPTNATNWTNRYPGTTQVPNVWPVSASLYGTTGGKMVYGTVAQGGDWVFDSTRANIIITIPAAQRIELGAGENEQLLLEMETLTTS